MDLFSRALKMTKEKDVPVLLAIARAQEMADSADANDALALDLLMTAIKRDKRDARLYVTMGNIFRRLGNGEHAYNAYQDALLQDPNNAEAQYRLGKIFVSQNNPDMYLKYFNNAVASDPNFAPAWYELYYHWYFRDVNKAMDYLQRYIAAREPGIVNDYLLTDLLYAYLKAAPLEKDTVQRLAFAKNLAELYKKEQDFSGQALWLGKYYTGNSRATNLDLFNWGLAHYMAKEYGSADSVFGLYETKYPEQEFGYYWRARSDAAIDTAMTTGMAIPHYLKLAEIDGKDTTNKTCRKHLIETYGYIAAYKANTEKDYPGAVAYFEKLLDLEPGNSDAQRYIAILKKNISKAEAKSAAKGSPKTGKESDAGRL